MKQFIILFSIAAASLMLIITPAQAQESVNNNSEQVTQDQTANKPEEKMRQGGKPPQTAIDACVDQTAQTKCSFQGPKELEFGVCEDTPDKKYFACKPDRNNIK